MLVFGIGVCVGWLGCFFEFLVLLEGGVEVDVQVFECGVNGLCYLNLMGLVGLLGEGWICLCGWYCWLVGELILWCVCYFDYCDWWVMVIVLYVDDVELVVFGFYSQVCEVWIVILIVGEIEIEYYCCMGFDGIVVVCLKGCLCVWDSQVVLMWGGVLVECCV